MMPSVARLVVNVSYCRASSTTCLPAGANEMRRGSSRRFLLFLPGLRLRFRLRDGLGTGLHRVQAPGGERVDAGTRAMRPGDDRHALAARAGGKINAVGSEADAA